MHPKSRDVKIENFSITFHGCELLQDALLELNCGRRYGLLGPNGSGKSTLLSVLGNREVPIPDHIDIFQLTREMPASDKTALQCVMEVDEERVRYEYLIPPPYIKLGFVNKAIFRQVFRYMHIYTGCLSLE